MTSFTAIYDRFLGKITDGSFDDIYIGDYIIDSNNKVYRIAGLDTELNKGEVAVSAHHAVIVPDLPLINMNWNESNSTSGGYQNSYIQAYCDNAGKNIIESVFGEEHVLITNDYLSSSVNTTVASPGYAGYTGASSGMSWSSHKARLMSEIEVFGCKIWSGSFDIGSANMQLPLFRLVPALATFSRMSYWLSGIASATNACFVSAYGYVNNYPVNNAFGVRPRFLIG